MSRCQRENLKEDATSCCGNKNCDALYLKSYYVPNKIYIGDYKTRFVGYYTKTKNPKDTAVLTGWVGGGTPIVRLFGFNSTATVCITGNWINKCERPHIEANDGNSYYNIDGSHIGASGTSLGIDLCGGHYCVPGGRVNVLNLDVGGYKETLYVIRGF